MKILVVRFSSIGDIVLTSPVVRCIKQQLPGAELHYVTKRSFEAIVANNPFVDKVFAITKSIDEVLPELKAEKYDFLVDLHNNIRTFSLKRKLKVPHAAFPKLHVPKWLLVKFKVPMKSGLHVVERYFEAVKPLKVMNDNLPCDFFISPQDEAKIGEFDLQPKQYIAFAIGAQYATKRLPVHKMIEIVGKIEKPVVLLGGPMDTETGEMICKGVSSQKVINSCGKMTLRESAGAVKQALALLTHDTGLMHIASAFEIRTVSVWGNTVPAFGMYPYFPQHKDGFSIHEVNDLPCRPCSKIGFQACPKKHFKCMELQNSAAIAAEVNAITADNRPLTTGHSH